MTVDLAEHNYQLTDGQLVGPIPRAALPCRDGFYRVQIHDSFGLSLMEYRRGVGWITDKPYLVSEWWGLSVHSYIAALEGDLKRANRRNDSLSESWSAAVEEIDSLRGQLLRKKARKKARKKD